MSESRSSDPFPPRKRARKDAPVTSEDSSQYHDSPSPVDHIFIAETLTSAKKPGGKKTPLSCCECRRLKLKCDRHFPCGSCRKRGVSDICPEGVLVSGKGTRFILANTEQLHSKVQEMSERIRALEDALKDECGSREHPLLSSDLLNVKSTMGLYGASGEPPVHKPEGPQQFTVACSGNTDSDIVMKEIKNTDDNAVLEAEISRLNHIFPLTEYASSEQNPQLRKYIRSKLPSKEEAKYLWTQISKNALWQYNPTPDATFFPNLLHHCYEPSLEEVSSRRLALMFMVLSVGSLVDLSREPECPEAERYHILARAALSEVNVMEDTTVETVTCLFYEIWYLLVFSDKKKAAGYAWGLMGLTAKLAQSIGLHRNGSKAKVIPEEVEKRRSLFWELLYLDARLSLSLGRPPSLPSIYMDCPLPTYIPDHSCSGSPALIHYQQWKHQCYIECLAPVLDVISKSPQDLDYNEVLELDKKIREFRIPPFQSPDKPCRSMIMQRASLSTAIDTVLLQLHRTFFTRALSGPERAFNRSHVYAPSVVAVFLSATRMIATIQELYVREPELTARILGYWSNAFSAAVALCLLASRAPFTCLAPATLQELQRALALFRSARDICPRAHHVTPILQSLVGKANTIYARWAEGDNMPTVVLRHTTNHDIEDPLTPTSPELMQGGDSFSKCHTDLLQCIVESHERARRMFPQRKPCDCSNRVKATSPCPPSHSWAPPPATARNMHVLPELFNASVLPTVEACTSPSLTAASLSPTSKFAVVDTLNFELGALNSTNPLWMEWF